MYQQKTESEYLEHIIYIGINKHEISRKKSNKTRAEFMHRK